MKTGSGYVKTEGSMWLRYLHVVLKNMAAEGEEEFENEEDEVGSTADA